MLSPNEIKKVRAYLDVESEDFAKIFKTLSDHNRCTIFRMLAHREGLTVSDTARVLGISLSLASQHLKILYEHGLTAKTRDGQQIRYELNRKSDMVRSLLLAIG